MTTPTNTTNSSFTTRRNEYGVVPHRRGDLVALEPFAGSSTPRTVRVLRKGGTPELPTIEVVLDRKHGPEYVSATHIVRVWTRS